MISIIGTGRVGSAVAFLCTASSLGDVALVGRDEKKAGGQAFDLSTAVPLDSDISITATSDYSKIAHSDVIVIAVSSGTHKQRRVEMMKDHTEVIKTISNNIARHATTAKILMITNPVDVLTYVFQKEGGFPPESVLGVSSSLDSSRFRYLLAKELKVSQSRISDALVLGEHDDSMVPIFSHAKLDGRPISEALSAEQTQNITTDLRNYWALLRDFHWYSVFGITKSTFDIIKSIVRDEPLRVPSSVLLDGQYGISDTCLGVPVTLGKHGIRTIHQIQITEKEAHLLQQSASRVRSNISEALQEQP